METEREEDLLASVKYTVGACYNLFIIIDDNLPPCQVFGLGNTTYEHYNSVGR